MTSSTAAPILGASASPDAHVRGYLSKSVVVLRLWKKRAVMQGRPSGEVVRSLIFRQRWLRDFRWARLSS